MKMKSVVLILPLAMLSLFMVMACGSGGGGESVTYNGNTMPAVIDTTDAVSTALDVTFAGEDSLGYIPLGAVSGGRPSLRDPVGAFFAEKEKIFGSDPAPVESLAWAESLVVYGCSTETQYGSHGGSAELTVCFQPTYVSWEIDANAYATTTMYADGIVILKERSDYSGTIIWRDWTYQDSDTSEDYFVDGWIDIEEVDADTERYVFNVAVVDFQTGDEFYLCDYTVIFYDDPGDPALDWVTIDGRYYDGEDGYIDIDTLEVIQWSYDNNDVPSDGILKFTGDNNYWIQIAFDTTSFTVSVDYTGDGTADWTSMPIPWV